MSARKKAVDCFTRYESTFHQTTNTHEIEIIDTALEVADYIRGTSHRNNPTKSTNNNGTNYMPVPSFLSCFHLKLHIHEKRRTPYRRLCKMLVCMYTKKIETQEKKLVDMLGWQVPRVGFRHQCCCGLVREEESRRYPSVVLVAPPLGLAIQPPAPSDGCPALLGAGAAGVLGFLFLPLLALHRLPCQVRSGEAPRFCVG